MQQDAQLATQRFVQRDLAGFSVADAAWIIAMSLIGDEIGQSKWCSPDSRGSKLQASPPQGAGHLTYTCDRLYCLLHSSSERLHVARFFSDGQHRLKAAAQSRSSCIPSVQCVRVVDSCCAVNLSVLYVHSTKQRLQQLRRGGPTSIMLCGVDHRTRYFVCAYKRGLYMLYMMTCWPVFIYLRFVLSAQAPPFKQQKENTYRRFRCFVGG